VFTTELAKSRFLPLIVPPSTVRTSARSEFGIRYLPLGPDTRNFSPLGFISWTVMVPFAFLCFLPSLSCSGPISCYLCLFSLLFSVGFGLSVMLYPVSSEGEMEMFVRFLLWACRLVLSFLFPH